MKVLLSGASGLVGSHILNQLLQDKSVSETHLICRTKTEIKSTRVMQHVVDYHHLDQLQLEPHFDIAFCALGTTLKKAGSKEKQIQIDRDFVVAFSELAFTLGVQHLGIVSSLGANANSSNFYLKVKGEMEERISAIDFDSIHFIRPSFLLGKRKENRPSENVVGGIMRFLSPLFFGKAKRYRAVESENVARTLIQKVFSKRSGIHCIESEIIKKTPEY